MEYNSGVSLILPDSIDSTENDFDDEDIVHEQKNQNEIVELIMAAFEGHDEPSDEDDDESLNSTDSSHPSSDEQQMLNLNNNNNNPDEQNESRHEQSFFPSRINSTSPSTVPRNELRPFHIPNNNEETPFHPQNHIVHYSNPIRSSSNPPTTTFHYLPTLDMTDPIQTEYLNESQNQLNKLRILCNVKDRKVSQLQNLCEEFRERYESNTRALKHQLELSERSKYDVEQRYQLLNVQYEDLIERHNQLHRTIKDADLKIQQFESTRIQFEKKFSDSELLIESLHRKVNELQEFESIARTQEDYQLILSNTREKHEQEIISLNEKLQNVQINFQEKNLEVEELRVQLEIANKNTEKSIFERMETINHLNEQLHDCQRKYGDLLTNNSFESLRQTELKQQLIHTNDENEKLQNKYHELESEIRTLRERLRENKEDTIVNIRSKPIDRRDSLDSPIFDQSIIDENILLKQRINEYIFKEKQLREMNEELQHQIELCQLTRSDSSSSSSSNSSSETVIITSVHMEQIRKLTSQIEELKKDFVELEEKHDYEKQELYSVIEQLREDVLEVDKTKQLYIDVCQEKNSIEDTLRSKLELEWKMKFDDLQRTFEEETQVWKRASNEDFERMKVKYEKQIAELNNELDRHRMNDDMKSRLEYMEKEFEQLKHDYYQLNIKQSDLLKTCTELEKENETLSNTLEQIKREKVQLNQKFDLQIKELTAHQEEELFTFHQQTDVNQLTLEEDIQSLQLRINNYENVITQYEDYRVKLENNLQKITQQRDTNKVELRLTREMLTNKENEFNQLKIHLEQCEKHLQTHQEQFRQYENTINDLEKQIQQTDLQGQETNQRQIAAIQKTEDEYREKLLALDEEKSQLLERLEEANRALDLADSHLKQEIEKIKISLEQEYNRRYERDHKQPVTNPSSTLLTQDIEDMKKMYRTEIDRLHRENIELSQHQGKLIDAHQKQMQTMKKELDDGYNNVINEFQREQVRLQTRYDQLKQQLNDAQQTIEQLKFNLNQLKINHSEEISKVKEGFNQHKYTLEHEHRTHYQHRLENLVQLLEQSNNTLTHERTIHARQENEHQQTIHSLQKKITDITKQYTKLIDELKGELHQERLANQNRIATRPISVPDFANDVTSKDIKPDYLTTVEKLRELFTNEMIALLRLTCKMIFDVHHRVMLAQCMDNLDIAMKKQIQNELIRSRNSMIKEIRREILEKMTFALRSERVPDIIVDKHIFELDRLLSQMVQDCLNSLPITVIPPPSNSTVLSFHIASPHPQSRPIVSESPSVRKSIECLYMTPTANKKPAPLAPHCRSTFDRNRRPKSASNEFLTNSHLQKFHRSINQTPQVKMHRSEDDIIYAIRQNNEQVTDLDHDDTLTLDEDQDQSTVQVSMKQFDPTTNSAVEHTQMKCQTPDVHYATTRIINHQKQEHEEDEELTWPQEPISTISSTQSNGIKKFVRNSLKLFITQPQHKRTVK